MNFILKIETKSIPQVQYYFHVGELLKKKRETKNTLIATNKFAYMEKIATWNWWEKSIFCNKYTHQSREHKSVVLPNSP